MLAYKANSPLHHKSHLSQQGNPPEASPPIPHVSPLKSASPVHIENPNPVSIHPMVTWFRVGSSRPPERLNLHVYTISPLRTSYTDAFNDPNWQNDVHDEYNGLIKNNFWTHVPRPTDANIVHCMWLFRHKHLADGTLCRYKASLVANGNTRLSSIDGDETFSPVIDGLFMVLRRPIGLGFSCKMLTVLGLLIVVVTHHYLSTDRAPALLICYCMLMILLQQIIELLHREFSMTDLGSINYFLGIFVARDSSGMFLSQLKYAIEILERAYMVSCNLSRTPVDTESKLGVDGDPKVCLYMHNPREPHFWALKRILRYVRGTLGYGLQSYSSSTTSLIAYLDADWAGCPITRRSTSGYSVFLGNSLLSWSFKRHPTLSRSSAKAELPMLLLKPVG
ncbi:ribonuclease H-like domain-containing protein [Tanacetum coccineum]|uniref:Ribonuclease H-like domain-containing protein n=1 Tax=Tanacetum coccineum TaxID=301880 RepID=A0ABQ5FH76_9ASTR